MCDLIEKKKSIRKHPEPLWIKNYKNNLVWLYLNTSVLCKRHFNVNYNVTGHEALIISGIITRCTETN